MTLNVKNTNFINIKDLSLIDINKIVVSNKFLFGKQDFKYFIPQKDNKTKKPYKTKTNLNMCILMYLKIHSDQASDHVILG